MDPATILTILTYAMIAIMIVGYASERVSIEIYSVVLIVGWLDLFSAAPPLLGFESPVTPDDLLAGFANPALITVLALLVVGQGLFHTDALAGPTAWLAGMKGSTTPVVLLLAAALLASAVVNDTPVVVMVLPVLAVMATRRNVGAASVLMALSFAAQLGGMTTLIGTSTNLLVAGVAHESAGIDIGFFDFTVPAAAMALVGFVYVAFVMPRLFANRGGTGDAARSNGRQFIAQMEVRSGDRLDGQTTRLGLFPALGDMTVRMVMRGHQRFLPPFDELTLQDGDMLIVAATRTALTSALSAADTRPRGADEAPERKRPARDMMVAEAVVAPGSRLVDRSAAHVDLYHDTSAVVLGVERRGRMGRAPLASIRLAAGDVLLMSGDSTAIEGLRGHHDLILMDWSAAEVPQRRLASRALAIFGAFVVYAAAGIGPVVAGALAAALAMVASGCLNVRQASRALDLRIYLMVGASLAAATALTATGGAELIADAAVGLVADQPAWVILSTLFLLVSLLTNVLSNNATAVLFAPIAIGIATRTGHDPLPFLVAVMLGASCAFATPMGYQTNLLVMGPGNYRFRDFLVAGTPLILITWIVFTIVAPWYYF